MSTKNTPAEKQTFEQQVNDIAAKFVVNGDELTLPDDIKDVPEPVVFAAKLEKRRRDTQSAFTKTQQRNKELEVEREALASKVESFALATLTAEENAELENLKLTDPDAWRIKFNELETAAKAKLKDETTNISKKARQETEVQRRERVLAEFHTANPTLVINDDVIANDIPPRFLKQLESGELNFETFLDKCKGYLTANKVIAPGADPKTGKTLDDVGGHSRPPEHDVERAAVKTYKTETY